MGVDLTEKYVNMSRELAKQGHNVNPNLLFLENEIENFDHLVMQGGTRCFAPNQKVVTRRGSVPISEMLIGDEVFCFDENTGSNEWKPVVDVLKFSNKKPTVKIKLKNGETIVCSADHKFFHNGEWVEIIKLLQ